MKVEEISSIIKSCGLEDCFLKKVDGDSRTLSVFFYANAGGEYENKVLEVIFEEILIINLPQYFGTSLNIRKANQSEIKSFVTSYGFYDEEDFYEPVKVFLFETVDGKFTGYYVAAESIEGCWKENNF